MTAIARHIGFLTHANDRTSKPIRQAKEHIKYIQADRAKETGEKVHRTPPSLFDRERDKVDRKELYKILDSQPRQGVVMHKFVFTMSEDELQKGDIDMIELTREAMSRFELSERREFKWVAAIHDDEGHVHAHVCIFGRDTVGKEVALYRGQLKKMNRIVEKTRERQAERNRGKSLEAEAERDILEELERERGLEDILEKKKSKLYELER